MQEVSSVCNLTKRRKGRQVRRMESEKESQAGTSSVRPLSRSLRQSQAEDPVGPVGGSTELHPREQLTPHWGRFAEGLTRTSTRGY